MTGQFNSSSNKNYVGTKFSCLKYDLQCTNFEPDKTYNTTMYVRPAKTQVSLCIDPLDKASFLHTVRSAKGLNRMCCCSRTVYSALDSPVIDGKYDQRMLIRMCRRVLTRVFARRTRRFVTPSNHRGYLRLAKALIRLLRSADVQSQSVQADPSLRTSFIVGFATHRLMCELFVLP